jgi:hypothetical protein
MRGISNKRSSIFFGLSSRILFSIRLSMEVIFGSSFDDGIFFKTPTMVLEDYSFLGMGLQILLC